MENRKNIFVLGCQGAGKSYLLNILIGQDPESDQAIFKVGETNTACTIESQFYQGSLYGHNKILLNVIDVPGLSDLDDQQKEFKNEEIPTSIQHLVQLNGIIKEKFDNQVNRVLLCIDANRKWDQTAKNLIKIANIIIPNKKNISVLITKTNTIKKKYRQKIEDSWRTELYSQSIENVFVFGENYDQVDNKFQIDLETSVPEKIRSWADLSDKEKNTIGECFNYKIMQNQQNIQKQLIDQSDQYQNIEQSIQNTIQRFEQCQNFIQQKFNDQDIKQQIQQSVDIVKQQLNQIESIIKDHQNNKKVNTNQIIDFKNRKYTIEIIAYAEGCFISSISKNEKYLAYVAYCEKILKIYDLKQKKIIAKLQSDYYIWSCQFSQDSSFLYAGVAEGYVYCYDVKDDFKEIFKLRIHKRNVFVIITILMNICLLLQMIMKQLKQILKANNNYLNQKGKQEIFELLIIIIKMI